MSGDWRTLPRSLRLPSELTLDNVRALAWDEFRQFRQAIGREPTPEQVQQIFEILERLASIATTTAVTELCNRVSELERHVAMLRQTARHERA
jgi:polyhydroxyalkanoate synthesis regulator phasin